MRIGSARRENWGAFAAVALLAGCGPVASEQSADSPGTAAPKTLSAAHLGRLKAGEASRDARMLIGRGDDYVPIAEDPATLFSRLEGSMADRRATAWKIVEAMLQPQRITIMGETYDVPLWHTWYEGMSANDEINDKINIFVGKLAQCKADPGCRKSKAEIARETLATAQGRDQKSLARSLVDANIRQTLHQFEGMANSPEEALGQGFTLFSPSFVEHVLTEAQNIEGCTNDRTAWDAPPPSSTQFSTCLAEFPRSAVMVKAQWAEMAQAGSNPQSGASAMTSMLASGTWPRLPSSAGDPAKMYTIETREGTQFGLRAIHFSTKDTREWIWVSLWWSPAPDDDYGQDRPASISRFNGGVWKNYKMCVTTSFKEGDAAPWRAFQNGQPALAAALRATHDALSAQRGPAPYDEVTSWCSNPNIEGQPNNGKTNCIGCHQYAMAWSTISNSRAGFGETLRSQPAFQREYPQNGRSRRRANFPGEFSWSFKEEEIPEAIASARRRYKYEW